RFIPINPAERRGTGVDFLVRNEVNPMTKRFLAAGALITLLAATPACAQTYGYGGGGGCSGSPSRGGTHARAVAAACEAGVRAAGVRPRISRRAGAGPQGRAEKSRLRADASRRVSRCRRWLPSRRRRSRVLPAHLPSWLRHRLSGRVRSERPVLSPLIKPEWECGCVGP